MYGPLVLETLLDLFFVFCPLTNRWPMVTNAGGGLPVSENRTFWPMSGGAVAVSPGWFTGHEHALMYINLGLGTDPKNYSMPMVPMFEVNGPSDNPFPDSFCLPKIQLPEGVRVRPGDNATIQVVQAAKHGAATFSVCIPAYALYRDPSDTLSDLYLLMLN